MAVVGGEFGGLEFVIDKHANSMIAEAFPQPYTVCVARHTALCQLLPNFIKQNYQARKLRELSVRHCCSLQHRPYRGLLMSPVRLENLRC